MPRHNGPVDVKNLPMKTLLNFNRVFYSVKESTGDWLLHNKENDMERDDELNIQLASPQQTRLVLELYRSLVGSPGCLWNEEYPGLEEVVEDQQRGGLYCLVDGQGQVLAAIGAIDAVDDPEIGELGCWDPSIKSMMVLSRLGVRLDCQRRGLARRLVSHVLEDVRRKGFDGVCLIAGKNNPAAVALYESMGFAFRGEGMLFDILWRYYDRKL